MAAIFGALALALILVGPILGLVAFLRSREIQRLKVDQALLLGRLERLEEAVRRLRRHEAESAARETEIPPEALPMPAPTPASATSPAAGSAPPVPPSPAAARPAAPTPGAKPPAPPVIPAQPGAPAAPRATSAAPPAAQPAFTMRAGSTAAPAIDWERWIGIRGAAVLGAVALGLAGLLFFRYSIEHGLVTPLMRVVSGTLSGLGCLVGAEWLRKRGYRTTAEAVSGAGLILLYAAFWAGHTLYGLIAMPVAFALMVLVTVTACLLSLRHASLLIAVLGLAGGFATPLLLSSGADRPIGLFGYVLMLDLGMLFVGARRRWPSLGLLCLLGTTLMQALWIGARMGPDRLALGLVILGLFALLFVLAGQRLAPGAAQGEARLWARNQMAGILLPFAFALYFAGRATLTEHLYPIALLIAPLVAGAAWVARGRGTPELSTGAAAASVAIVGVFVTQHSLTTPLAWELALTALALTGITHLFVELDPMPHGETGPAPAALVAAFGFFLILIVGATRSDLAPWPWLGGWLAIAAILYRHATFPRRAFLQIPAAIGAGIGLSLLHLAHLEGAHRLSPSGFLALLFAAALAAQGAAFARRREDLRAAAEHAAAALAVLLLLGLAPAPFMQAHPPALPLGAAVGLGLLAALAATRLASGGWYAAAAGATLLVQAAWTYGHPGLRENPDEALAALGIIGATVALFTFWPLLAGRRLAGSRAALYTAALAGPLWFSTLRTLYRARFGNEAIGILPLLLGALALAAAVGARRARPGDDPAGRTALVWFSGVAISFVALAIPLQLEKEWITIGWAVEGLALIALWKRLDHPGLKWFALGLLGAAAGRLVLNPAVLGYYPRSASRLLNWLMYTYLVPAVALVGSAAILRPLEAARARDWERDAYAGGRAIGAAGAGLAAIAVVFVWINLAIADWYATGPVLTLSFGTEPAQRLTVSIAWALYALLLLGLGMARRAMALRWISLAFLLVTIGKVFLYDLGALQDLYRVASLVGLAVSLILVSLLYQRFVFRGAREDRG
ncbi:MAG TPA: DUF2339 domain-containing protein [Dongiaceae bacterium]|nr:DUF2339 domain-containing protein [Dongiaceae bacterium]